MASPSSAAGSQHRLLLRAIKALPQAHTPAKPTWPPGRPFPLYSGTFAIDHARTRISGRGKVWYSWLPSPAVFFKLKTRSSPPSLSLGPVGLALPKGWTRGEARLTRITVGPSGVTYEGILNGPIQHGASRPCRQLRFHLTNFHHYAGERIRSGSAAHPNAFPGRLRLQGSGYLLDVDERFDCEPVRDALRARGGYAITHTAAATRVDGGSLSRDEADALVDALHYFFAFARGCWCGPLLPAGLGQRGETWAEWGPWKVTAWLNIGSWFPANRLTGISEWFDGFLRKWQQPLWTEPLRLAIHWYVDANVGGSAVETGLVLAQVSLELLGWVHLVEDTARLSAAAFDRLDASAKIRLLLAELSIPAGIPGELAELTRAAAAESFTDGPAAVVGLRNALVHPKAAKRRLVSRTSGFARFEALQLALEYVELVLLALFNYQGVYLARRYGTSSFMKHQKVPWAP